jgi:hypothetical protein
MGSSAHSVIVCSAQNGLRSGTEKRSDLASYYPTGVSYVAG